MTTATKQSSAAAREATKRDYARELHERNTRLAKAADALGKVLDNITRGRAAT
mgnify:CR=1 FL=1